MIYLGHEWAEKSSDTTLTEVMSWLEQRGNDKREYKNALALVIPNKAQIGKARKAGRTAEAIASLIKDKAKYKFSPEDLEELNDKCKAAISEIGAAVRRLYDYILLPVPNPDGANPIRLETIDLQSQLNTSQNLQDRVLDALKSHVFGSVTTAKLIRLSGLEDRESSYITGDELISYFFRFPTYPKILGADAVKQAVVKAVQQGLMGYVPYSKVLLVVDQFGEVFTICADEERSRFIECLTQMVAPLSRLLIVTTMRADFLEPCFSYRSLAQLIQDWKILALPMDEQELESAIVEPAQRQQG